MTGMKTSRAKKTPGTSRFAEAARVSFFPSFLASCSAGSLFADGFSYSVSTADLRSARSAGPLAVQPMHQSRNRSAYAIYHSCSDNSVYSFY